jgi:hypothetical protein
MHYNCKKQPQSIDNYVALPSCYLFVRVSASARAALPLGTGRLGIDNCRTGTWIASSGHAGGPANPVANALKEVGLPPFPEMIVDSLPGWEFLRKHSPLAAAFHQVKHSVK